MSWNMNNPRLLCYTLPPDSGPSIGMGVVGIQGMTE
jgi:hypothetical protein